MTLRELWEDFKAWRRGEKRVAPYGTRGRIYQRKNEENSVGHIEAKSFVKKGTIRARVKRADGTIEDLGVIAQTNPDN